MVQKSYTLSDFLRRSGEVLAALEFGEVVLHRRDDDDVVCTTSRRAKSIDDAFGLLARVVREALRDGRGTSSATQVLAYAEPWTRYLTVSERESFLRELTASALAAAEIGASGLIAELLENSRDLARSRAHTRPVSAHKTRPVAIPDDVDAPAIEKASGVVDLPTRVRWSGPKHSYDLDDAADRRSLYEQVMSEGNDDDVRRFIDVETLVQIWDELYLPERVRSAWTAWLRRHRGTDPTC